MITKLIGSNPTPHMIPITCQSCQTGTMQRRKKYLLGTPGALLRFLLILTGVIALVLGIIGLLATDNSGDKQESLAQLRVKYESRGLATSMVENIMPDGIYNGNKSLLDIHTRGAIEQFETEHAKITTGNSLVGTLSFLAGGLSKFALITGILLIALGFLLGLRRWKLVCNECGDTTAAP